MYSDKDSSEEIIKKRGKIKRRGKSKRKKEKREKKRRKKKGKIVKIKHLIMMGS